MTCLRARLSSELSELPAWCGTRTPFLPGSLTSRGLLPFTRYTYANGWLARYRLMATCLCVAANLKILSLGRNNIKSFSGLVRSCKRAPPVDVACILGASLYAHTITPSNRQTAAAALTATTAAADSTPSPDHSFGKSFRTVVTVTAVAVSLA